MPYDKIFNKTWQLLLGIAGGLFLTIGLVMLIIDSRYFDGARYLISAILFLYTTIQLTLGKIRLGRKNFDDKYIALGFIFAVIGLTAPADHAVAGVWVLGVILFLGGILINSFFK